MGNPPPTWKQLVAESLASLGGEAPLSALIEALHVHPLRPRTATWQATVRRVVRQYKVFEPFKTKGGRAAYRLLQESQVPETGSVPFADAHGEVQGMLLQIGRICGYETFTNTTDRVTRRLQGESIAQFATVRNDAQSLRGLPLERIRTIDVMWMAEDAEGLYPKIAFEVEESTKVKNGLIRLLRIPQRYHTLLYVIGKGQQEFGLFSRYIQDSPFREHSNRLCFRYYTDVKSFFSSGVEFAKNRACFLGTQDAQILAETPSQPLTPYDN